MTWQHSFPDCFITHGLFYGSDHRPIIINPLGLDTNVHGPRPLRFQAAWLTDDASWAEGSAIFKSNALSWNKHIFGNIYQQKQRIINKLHGIDKIPEDRLHDNLITLHTKLWKDYNDILTQEELLWY